MKIQFVLLTAFITLFVAIFLYFFTKIIAPSPPPQTFARSEKLPQNPEQKHPDVSEQTIKSEIDTFQEIEPRFKNISIYQTTIPGSGDPADIYYPNPSEISDRAAPFPIALLLQGLNVDKSHYSEFAKQVAGYGFIVVVPNHRTTVRGREELFAQVGEVNDVLEYMKAQKNEIDTPFSEIIDSQKLVLIGHSQGGFITLDAIREACDPPFCEGNYSRPKELIAGVAFGADLWENGEYIKIENAGIPTALIAGDKDSLILADSIEKTYDHIQTSPKAYITILGANHYGITNVNNPTGSPLEKSLPLLEQSLAIATIARWTALFLRAYALNDTQALEYVHVNGDAIDENVRVVSEP